MPTINYQLLTVLLILLLSCNSSKKNQVAEVEPTSPKVEPQIQEDTPQQEGNMEEQILGDWEWFKTNCCYRTPKTTYADTTESKTILNFTENNQLEYYQGEKLTKTTGYKIVYGLMDDKRPTLKIDHRTALLYIRNDTLIIDYGYMDLQTEFYLRK